MGRGVDAGPRMVSLIGLIAEATGGGVGEPDLSCWSTGGSWPGSVGGGVVVTVTQEPLDFEPQVLPDRSGGVRGSTKSAGSNAGSRGYAAPYGPHCCSACCAVWTGARAAHCSACHRSFASVGLFDAHRSIAGEHGVCRDPVSLTVQSGQRASEPVMVFRDGMWRSPEMSDEEKAAAFRERTS